MGGWDESGSLTSRTWRVVKGRPYLLGFPVAGGLLAMVAFTAFAVPGLLIANLSADDPGSTSSASSAQVGNVWGLVALFVVGAYAAVLVAQFFLGGLVHCADQELRGTASSFGAGVAAAGRRFGAIAGWAGIQTAVGWLLSAVRGGGGGNAVMTVLRLLLASLLSVAWALITMFVLPLIVLEGRGPFSAIKESFGIFRSKWGTQIAGSVRIGAAIGLLVVLPAILLVLGGGYLLAIDNTAYGVPALVVGVLALIAGSVLLGAMKMVFSVALFRFATAGEVLGPFTHGELESAVRIKA